MKRHSSTVSELGFTLKSYSIRIIRSRFHFASRGLARRIRRFDNGISSGEHFGGNSSTLRAIACVRSSFDDQKVWCRGWLDRRRRNSDSFDWKYVGSNMGMGVWLGEAVSSEIIDKCHWRNAEAKLHGKSSVSTGRWIFPVAEHDKIARVSFDPFSPRFQLLFDRISTVLHSFRSFWTNSILEKPDDGRDLICHASAWDFYLNSDVRIKQCSRINVEDLGTAHHELGHIQYFLQYENQPFIYRTGANPGFHEAVGDVIGLSVLTPKHLHQIGLIKEFQSDNEAKLNNLFEKALEKVVILPFALTIDQYRWAIFRGQIKPENYNCGYWKLRLQNTGLRPPNKAPKKDGFDAGAKYHVSADVEYLRWAQTTITSTRMQLKFSWFFWFWFSYAISTVLQFQIQKSLCIKAGEYEPGNPDKTLADCDIYNSAAAGNALK